MKSIGALAYLELKKRKPAHSDLDFPLEMQLDQGIPTGGKGEPERQR